MYGWKREPEPEVACVSNVFEGLQPCLANSMPINASKLPLYIIVLVFMVMQELSLRKTLLARILTVAWLNTIPESNALYRPRK